jgi:hypothetical protein
MCGWPGDILYDGGYVVDWGIWCRLGLCNRKVDVFQAGDMLPAVGISQARRNGAGICCISRKLEQMGRFDRICVTCVTHIDMWCSLE